MVYQYRLTRILLLGLTVHSVLFSAQLPADTAVV